MTDPDYAVSPAVLAETAAGIDAVIDELRAMGPPGAAELGRGVALLGPLPGAVGHAGLSAAFLDFCERWEWGMRAAVRLGEDLADDLRAAGVGYARTDEDLTARLADDLVGDPAATGATWHDVAAAVHPDPSQPDWGAVAGQWAETAHDIAEHSWPALIARVLAGENPYAGQLDDLRPIVE